ncbi:surfeit locus protein 1 [Impatiens glandulifera]|uniref:surfeit locus protein 1 n=1 Tax=Impatiens glandulifera TaxID=253017 RepID=UPI001FB09354|nr:surfeit locus protein 1 [Impatiens glandulifera]
MNMVTKMTTKATASISKTLAAKLNLVHRSALASSSLQRNPLQSDCSYFSTSAVLDSSSSPIVEPPLPPPLSVSPPQENTKGSSWSKFLLYVPGAITFGLGTWQLFRRQEKIEMLEYSQKRLGMEPLNGNQLSPSADSLDELELRRVAIKGVFDDKNSIFIGPRSRSISGITENGYYVITPLMPVPGYPESLQFPVLVNRGWVPRSWREKHLEALEHDDQPSNSSSSSSVQVGERSSWWKLWSKKPKLVEEKVSVVTPVEVVGVVRGSEKPSIFVPENDPISSQWFYVDVPSIRRTCGVPANTVYIEEMNEHVNPSNPYPVPKDVNTFIRSSVMPQDHLNYTFTWYSLSAAVTYMAYKRTILKMRRR